MNYMADVAKLLGVEIGEEFSIDNLGGRYKFGDDNLLYYSLLCGGWIPNDRNIKGLINGTYKIIKIPKSILDDIEKKYLFRFIRPFKERINYIVKLDVKDIDDEREYILIIYKEPYNISIPRLMELPSFKKGAMYKGMKLGERYTYKELGL